MGAQTSLRVMLWDAINNVVAVSGGSTSCISTERQVAVAEVERVLRDMLAAERQKKLHALVDGDGEVRGIYSTLVMAAKAMERLDDCQTVTRELDKLPDEPEPRGEPDYGAPSAAERLERDSFDADRGGAR